MSGILKKWLCAIVFLATFFVLIVVFFPVLVEEFVLPPVLARAGLADYKFSISRLGLNGCSLHVSGQSPFSSPVVAGKIRIDWTPSGLLHRRIEKVSSNGLQVNLVGLPPKKLPSQVKPKHEKGFAGHANLPIIVEQVTVNNGSLFFPAGKRIVYLPFTFSGHRTGDQDLEDPAGAINFQARMQMAEQVVNATVILDPSLGKLSGKLDSNFDLASLASLVPLPGILAQKLKGNVQVNSAVEAQIAPFVMGPVEAAFIFNNVLIIANDFSVRTQERQPARVTISGLASQFRLKGTGFHVEGPLRTALDFDTTISSVKNSLEWEGTLDLTPEAGTVLHDSVMLKDVRPVRISHAGSRSEGKAMVLLTTGQCADRNVGSSFVVQQGDITAAVEKFDIDARITYEQQSELNILAGTLSVNGSNVMVNSPQGDFKVPKLVVQAEATVSPGQDSPSFTACLNVDDASLNLEKQHLEVQGMQLELPVAWPSGGHVKKGSLQMDTILLDKRDLGRFTAEIVQNMKDLTIDGILQTPLFPKEKISLSGSIRLPKQKGNVAELAFALRDGHVAIDNFVPVFPALLGISGTGIIDGQGNLAMSPCGLSGQAELALNNGRLSFKEAETEVEDIVVSLRFPALPSLKTAPTQHFSIGTIRKKKIVISDMKTLFEIESPGSLFVERISGRWSGGRVFTSSFRLQKDQEEFDVALFCDRLELPAILSQFGLAEAGGEGRMSGRVPLVYNKGKFFVDDGFLFSTPGEKGFLKIKQSQYLETTIPADVQYFSPLHFAGAALADFEYNWAKLQIKSEEENLLLKLQVDGKPREKLPFRFDTKNNVFVRLGEGEKGGINQPVTLDVNFNVPVNEIFQYKDKFMPLFRKFN